MASRSWEAEIPSSTLAPFWFLKIAPCVKSKYSVSIRIAFVMQDTPAGTLQRKKSLPYVKCPNLTYVKFNFKGFKIPIKIGQKFQKFGKQYEMLGTY